MLSRTKASEWSTVSQASHGQTYPMVCAVHSASHNKAIFFFLSSFLFIFHYILDFNSSYFPSKLLKLVRYKFFFICVLFFHFWFTKSIERRRSSTLYVLQGFQFSFVWETLVILLPYFTWEVIGNYRIKKKNLDGIIVFKLIIKVTRRILDFHGLLFTGFIYFTFFFISHFHILFTVFIHFDSMRWVNIGFSHFFFSFLSTLNSIYFSQSTTGAAAILIEL